MHFTSTRKGTKTVNFTQAAFNGLAPDGGLYIPVERPNLTELFLSFKRNCSFNDVAGATADALFTPEIEPKTINRIIQRAFHFSPQIRIIDEQLSFLELYHGPTFAFKDFGAFFLASLMEELLIREDKRALVLVATSGDTGSAVANAFFGKKNITVILLYPSQRVSPLQEKQLTTLGGNIVALEVQGTFDDCQKMVKEAFKDNSLTKSFIVTSANSINCGRLIPQSFYYIYAFTQLDLQKKKSLIFCVPSGNFGNLTSGLYAWYWGLPVKQFIAATNINDVFPEYLKSGIYTPRRSQDTLSTAMDVGNPSNSERLKALFKDDAKSMRQWIHGEVVEDGDTLAAISYVQNKYKLFVDPHTAVGFMASRRYIAQARKSHRNMHIVIVATAHPAKFRETVQKATGLQPPLPSRLKAILTLPKKSILLGNTKEELCEFLRTLL